MDDSAPRWLDEHEQRTWMALAHLLMRLPLALDTQMRREAGMSHFEYIVMAALSMSPTHALRMSDLAEFSASSLSRLSNVVSRLEARGWVQRGPDPDDGRITQAILTQSGLDKVVDSAPGHVTEVRRLIFDPLTAAQVRQLGEISRRVTRAIDPDDDCLDDPLTRLRDAGARAAS